MYVSRIRIQNIMGIEGLEFAPGRFNVVSGKNGQGKTSFIEAMKAIARGTDQATLLRNGAKKGEIVFVLDDGTEITQRFTERGPQPTIVEKDGHRVPQPATVLKALADIIAVNPVEFIRARKKDRVDILLESLPIKVDPVALSEIAGHPVILNPRLSPFEQVDFLRQAIFDERTGTNRALKEKRATIDQLNQTLPNDQTAYAAEDESGLLAEVDRIDGERDAEFERVNKKLTLVQQGHDQTVASIRENTDEKVEGCLDEIRRLEQKIADQKEQIGIWRTGQQEAIAEETAKLNDLKSRAAKQREITATNHAQTRASVAGQLDAIRLRAQQAARVQNTRDTIEQMNSEAAALEVDAQRQTVAINGIDAYKSELLASLPVSGLEVRDGEIFRCGIPFDRLNTAQQIAIAVEIAKLRSGELRVVCVDGIEALDKQHFDEFQRQIVSAELQAFVAKVADGDFELAVAA